MLETVLSHLKLFLDRAQFFRGCYSCDAWTAQSRDFLETTRDEMARNLAKCHFMCFDFQKTLHKRDVFNTLSRRFVRLGFCLNCAIILPFILGFCLNGNGNECNGSSASMRYNSLFISLPFFTKQQREITTF